MGFGFALIGVALFVLYQAVSPGDQSSRVVIVSEQTIDMLAERYAAVWRRPPTESELQSLINNHVREEILYREGVAIGLDRNDKIIQRRVLQKLEVLGEETNALSPPTDEDLNEYLHSNAELYATPPILDFQQVLFDPGRHGEQLEADFSAAMSALIAGADPETLGDSTMLPTSGSAISADRLGREFGKDFADALVALPVGNWEGPIRSGYGVHIVRVDNRIEEQAAILDDARAAVERDWENDRRTNAAKVFYEALLSLYDVRIEMPLPAEPRDQAAE